MKKLAKILLAVLVVATLVGVLAFAVSADTTGEATSTAFNPTDETWAGKYANIAWAAWTDEAAYTNGDAPKYWFQNADEAATGTDGGYTTAIYPVDNTVGYYHVFSEGLKFGTAATAPGYIQFVCNTTINFDNHTVAAATSNAMNLQGGNITFKNGTIDFAAVGYIRPGDNGQTRSHVFENMTINSNYSALMYGGAFKEIKFIGCTINYSGNTSSNCGFFHLNTYQLPGDTVRKMAFEATTINVTGKTENKGLFGVWTQSGFGTNVDVTFDKDSKIVGTVTRFISITNAGQAMNNPIEFYFEEGFSASPSALTSIVSGGYFTRSGISNGAPDRAGDISLWTSDTEAADWTLEANPVRVYIVSKGDSTDADYTSWTKMSFPTVCPLDSNTNFKLGSYTDDEITFKIWASEADKNNAPLYVGIGNLTVNTFALPGATTNCYVELQKDTDFLNGTADSQADVGSSGRTIVIDLNDKTLAIQNRIFKVGGSFEFKNGNVVAAYPNGFQMQAASGAKFYMTEVDYSATILGYFSTLSELVVKDSKLTLTGALPISFASHAANIEANVKFINTDIICTSKDLSALAYDRTGCNYQNNSAIVSFFMNADNATANNWNLVFDKDSSITCTNVTNPNFVTFTGSVDAFETALANNGPFVTIEEGFSTGANSLPDMTYYKARHNGAGAIEARNDNIFTIVDSNGNVITDFHGVLNADGTYALTKTESKPTLGSDLQANLTLYSNFELNFFAQGIVKGIYNNGVAITAEEKQVTGRDKYVIAVPVNEAADELDLLIKVAVGEETHIYPATYSVLDYANQIIDGTYAADAKELITAAMNYANAAYAASSKAAFEFSGVALPTVENTNATVESINAAISGAQLDLGSGFKFRFNLKSDFNGTLAIGENSWEVVDGKFGELTYVEVDLRAYELADALAISIDGGEVVYYGIGNYAKAVNNDLVNALYTYCQIAKTYRANNY